MICFPNAKINIGLNIVSKREDGFHNLESVFVPVPLTDALEVLPSVHFEIVHHGISIELKKEEDHLCYKAWNLLHTLYTIDPVKIVLLKKIPMGAGLGGGSSDAAFTLKLLNEKFSLGLDTEKLKELALSLGSDCPFFMENTPKFVQGRGEVFSDLVLDLKGYYIALIHPKIHVSTPYAYSLIAPKQSNFDLRTLASQPIHAWKDHVFNDFELPILKLHPILQNIKDLLYQNGALYASMSGSGSAMYGIFSKDPQIDTWSLDSTWFSWQGQM